MHWRWKWQPTPVFLPGESQGQGSLVGCRFWGRTELDTTEVTQQQQQQQGAVISYLSKGHSPLIDLRVTAVPWDSSAQQQEWILMTWILPCHACVQTILGFPSALGPTPSFGSLMWLSSTTIFSWSPSSQVLVLTKLSPAWNTLPNLHYNSPTHPPAPDLDKSGSFFAIKSQLRGHMIKEASIDQPVQVIPLVSLNIHQGVLRSITSIYLGTY